MLTIAIIGGGFSGTLTAVHLLRQGVGRPGRLIILNRSGATARGVAYGTQSSRHVLNVPAGGMSAFEQDPDSFLRFVREQDATSPPPDADSFVCRHLYGAYLEWLLTDAAAHAADMTLERRTAEAITIEPSADAAAASIALSDGTRIRADRVVLAIGNYPPQMPAPLAGCDALAASARFVADPWRPDALSAVDLREPALLIGTGLTMVDIALELSAQGMTGPMIAVSRRGLVPLPHASRAAAAGAGAVRTPVDRAAAEDATNVPAVLTAPTAGGDAASDRASRPTHDLAHDLTHADASVRAYVRIVRRHLREAAASGADWRSTIAALRPVTARLWQRLPEDERRRFLRHVRPYWEVHRHRVAPQLHAAFSALQRDARLSTLAARLLRAEPDEGGVRITLCPRGSCEPRELRVGTVINCTGPAGDTRRLRDALFERLQDSGLLRADPLGLGIDTSPTGALIGTDGRPSPILYYVGPFTRARDWEATAVPELRRYAHALAAHLIDSLRSR